MYRPLQLQERSQLFIRAHCAVVGHQTDPKIFRRRIVSGWASTLQGKLDVER